jgi:serine/threonine protein kinase
MGYGPRESTSSSSWRSLLDSCLGATRAAGDEVRASHEPAGQQAPFVADKDRLSSPVASGSDLHAFTYAELRAATGGFPSRNIIGEGGFGAVYMGSLEDGVRPGLVAQAVAVKRGLADDYVEELLVCASGPALNFIFNLSGELIINLLRNDQKEAMFVAQLQHRHPSLVKMIGYCYHGNQRLLVYEFMDHGSLDNYLSKRTYARKLQINVLNLSVYPHMYKNNKDASSGRPRAPLQ